jgi:uncharacterized protein with HEPN domain
MTSRLDLERVRDILDCIEAIDRAEATMQRYAGDPDSALVAADAVRYRVTRIGEAVGSLSPDLREDRPAVPWSDLARLPDAIDGHHDSLDPQWVRTTIGEPVRRLRAACRAILGESVRIGEDEP